MRQANCHERDFSVKGNGVFIGGMFHIAHQQIKPPCRSGEPNRRSIQTSAVIVPPETTRAGRARFQRSAQGLGVATTCWLLGPEAWLERLS